MLRPSRDRGLAEQSGGEAADLVVAAVPVLEQARVALQVGAVARADRLVQDIGRERPRLDRALDPGPRQRM